MAQDHVPYEDDFRKIVGIDPAANWLLNVARTDYLPEGDATPIPILFEIGGDAAERHARHAVRHAGLRAPLTARISPDHLPLVVSPDFFVSLRDNPDNRALRDYADKRIVLSDTHTRGAEGPVPDGGRLRRAPSRDLASRHGFRRRDRRRHRVRARALPRRQRRHADRGLLGHEPLAAHFPVPPLPPFPGPPPVSLPYLPFPVAGELFNADIDAMLPAGAGGEDEIYASSGLINSCRPPPQVRRVARRAWHPRPRPRGRLRPRRADPRPPDHRGPAADARRGPDHRRAARLPRRARDLLHPRPGLEAEREPSAPARGDQHQLRLHRRTARRHGAGRDPSSSS